MATKAEDIREQIDRDLTAVQNEQNGNPEANTPAEEPSTDSDIWGSMANDLESDELIESETPSGTGEAEREEEVGEAPASEAPPVDTPPEEDSTPPGEKQVTPPEAPVQEEPPAQPPQPPEAQTPPEAPPAEQKTPEQLESERQADAQRRQESRNQALDALAKSYALTDEEAEGFVQNPQETIPKFGARLLMDTYDAVTASLMQALPKVVQQVNQQAEAKKQAEDAFYSANPALDQAKHGDLVTRYAQAYVQVNPKAKAEDIIRDVGIQVMYAAGIDPTKEVPSAGQAGNTQGNRQPQGKQAPAAPPPPPPHKPAGTGARTAQPMPDADNPWAQMAEEMEEDEG